MNADDEFMRALTGDDREQTVTLARTYQAPVAVVWEAITTPERIARWYGRITGPVPRAAGDAFEVDIGGGMVRRAALESCQAPTALSYTWWSGDDDPGLVRVRLEPAGEAETRLIVQHDRLRPHRMVQYGGGWEQNLVALAGVLGAATGQDVPPQSRDRRWELIRTHPLRLEVSIDATVAEVWGAWTSADALSAWWWTHWDDVAIAADVRVGGRYRIDAPRHGIAVTGEYLVVDPGRRLAFTWLWADDDPTTLDEAVDVTFRQTERGTALSVRHTGPWETGARADSYREGWEFVLAELSRRVAGTVAHGRPGAEN